jgi:hypothetical protein
MSARERELGELPSAATAAATAAREAAKDALKTVVRKALPMVT